MRAVVVTICCLVAAVLGLAAQVRTGTLTIYYIDTEGGQSTLFVGPDRRVAAGGYRQRRRP